MILEEPEGTAMRNIWVQCSECGILFNREEGRRAKGIVCPQCRTRLLQEYLLQTECSLCGRITLTKNGICPWCDEKQWADEAEIIVSEPEKLPDTHMSIPLTNVCHIQYPAGKYGQVYLNVSYQGIDSEPALQIVRKAAAEVLQDVLYDCMNEKECRKLLGRPDSKRELTRMIGEAIMDEPEFDHNVIDITTLQISDLEVRNA